MKHRFLIISLILLLATMASAQVSDSASKLLPVYKGEKTASLDNLTGWCLQNDGEWVKGKNKIPNDRTITDPKSDEFKIGKDNISLMEMYLFTYEKKEYVLLAIHSEEGYYELPILKSNWKMKKIINFYVFDKRKIYKLLASASTKKPFSVNLNVWCSGSVDNETKLTNIKNIASEYILKTKQNAISNSSNLVFSLYPITKDGEDKMYFKITKTYTKKAIYDYYLMPENQQKMFERSYYETDRDDFDNFINTIISQSDTTNKTYESTLDEKAKPWEQDTAELRFNIFKEQQYFEHNKTDDQIGTDTINFYNSKDNIDSKYLKENGATSFTSKKDFGKKHKITHTTTAKNVKKKNGIYRDIQTTSTRDDEPIENNNNNNVTNGNSQDTNVNSQNITVKSQKTKGKSLNTKSKSQKTIGKSQKTDVKSQNINDNYQNNNNNPQNINNVNFDFDPNRVMSLDDSILFIRNLIQNEKLFLDSVNKSNRKQYNHKKNSFLIVSIGSDSNDYTLKQIEDLLKLSKNNPNLIQNQPINLDNTLKELKETEKLYIDSITQQKKYIYPENNIVNKSGDNAGSTTVKTKPNSNISFFEKDTLNEIKPIEKVYTDTVNTEVKLLKNKETKPKKKGKVKIMANISPEVNKDTLNEIKPIEKVSTDSLNQEVNLFRNKENKSKKKDFVQVISSISPEVNKDSLNDVKPKGKINSDSVVQAVKVLKNTETKPKKKDNIKIITNISPEVTKDSVAAVKNNITLKANKAISKPSKDSLSEYKLKEKLYIDTIEQLQKKLNDLTKKSDKKGSIKIISKLNENAPVDGETDVNSITSQVDNTIVKNNVKSKEKGITATVSPDKKKISLLVAMTDENTPEEKIAEVRTETKTETTLSQGKIAIDTLAGKVFYSIQIGCLSDINSELKFRNTYNVTERIYLFSSAGKYKYCVGIFKKYKNAEAHLKKVLAETKLPGAYIVGFVNGQVVPISVAKAKSGESKVKYTPVNK